MTTNDDMPESFRDGEAPAEITLPASVPSHVDDAGDAFTQEKKPRGKPKAAKPAKAGKAAGAAKAEKVRKEPKEKKARQPRQGEEKFDVTSLPAERQAKVMLHIDRVNVLGRKAIENMLDLGETVNDLAVEVDNPNRWRDIIETSTSYDYMTAEDWLMVHNKFASRRAEILTCSVPPTVLIALLPATDEQVDAVLASFDAGKRLKVRKGSALVRSGQKSVATTTARGGAQRLSSLGAAQLASRQICVIGALLMIEQEIVSALEAAGTKRLAKGKLVQEIVPLARVAHNQLAEMICDFTNRFGSSTAPRRYLPVEDEAWAEVMELLSKMTTANGWPQAARLKAWLSEEVMPLLAFALDGFESVTADDTAMLEVAEAEATVEGSEFEAVEVAAPKDVATKADDAALNNQLPKGG